MSSSRVRGVDVLDPDHPVDRSLHFRDAPPATRAVVTIAILAALVLPLLIDGPHHVPITVKQIVTAVVLVLASVGNVELGRLLDRAAREQQRPHKGMAAWAMACIVLLPAWYLIPVLAGTYTHAWLRDRQLPAWKWFGAAGYMVLAALCADAILGRLPAGAVLSPFDSGPGVVLVLAACLTSMVVESLMLVAFTVSLRPNGELWLRRSLTDPLYYATEFGVLTLGAVTGLVAATAQWYALLMAPAFLLMQEAVLHRPLQERADLDAKTGVLQFRTWQRLADAEVTRMCTERKPWALLFADLDHFHLFNQVHGHLGGDRALAVTAATLRQGLNGGAVVGRFGGEEFCILLPGVAAPQAVQAAERLRVQVGALGPPHIPAPITVSIGVAVVDRHHSDVTVADALTLADAALYEAKQAGRNATRLAHAPAAPGGTN